jgi:hypothetical protein
MIERTSRRELEGAAREADDAPASLIRMVVPTKSSPSLLQRAISEVDEALRELRTRVAAPLERGLPKPRNIGKQLNIDR